MKTPKFELIDGILPGQGPYISINIPPEWLTHEAFEDRSDLDSNFFINIDDLILSRIQNGRSSWNHPDVKQAKITIEHLRKYADLLESTFVLSADAILIGENDEEIFLNSKNSNARVFLTDAETTNLNGRWKLKPCNKGHTEILAENSQVTCQICGEQVSGEWTKDAAERWNFEHALKGQKEVSL